MRESYGLKVSSRAPQRPAGGAIAPHAGLRATGGAAGPESAHSSVKARQLPTLATVHSWSPCRRLGCPAAPSVATVKELRPWRTEHWDRRQRRPGAEMQAAGGGGGGGGGGESGTGNGCGRYGRCARPAWLRCRHIGMTDGQALAGDTSHTTTLER